LVWVTDVALQTLLNDKYKLESLQWDGSRTRQAIPQNARWKPRACNCCHNMLQIANSSAASPRETQKLVKRCAWREVDEQRKRVIPLRHTTRTLVAAHRLAKCAIYCFVFHSSSETDFSVSKQRLLVSQEALLEGWCSQEMRR